VSGPPARWTAGPEARQDRSVGCTVTVCRDCCCGSAKKHPDVDHDDQLRQLRAGLPAPHRVRVSDCLDACEQSNVVVVHPTPAARRAGARPVWFGLVVSDDVTDDIAGWVQAGGPGVAPLPAVLELSVVPAPNPDSASKT
jgi:(2Fe-2S) ferredoxin